MNKACSLRLLLRVNGSTANFWSKFLVLWLRKYTNSSGFTWVSGSTLLLIVSITKFSIVIGSSGCLSRSRCTIKWVLTYRYPMLSFCNWIYLSLDLYTYAIRTSITWALMASFLLFPHADARKHSCLKTLLIYSLKRSSHTTVFSISKFVIDTIN